MYINEYDFYEKQPDLKSYLVNFSYKNKLFHCLKHYEKCSITQNSLK